MAFQDRATKPAPRARKRRDGGLPVLALVVAGALVWALLLPGPSLAVTPPDLGPVMPEVDGVHPARALEALQKAYAPGQGFPDKHPPLGSVLMGLAVAPAGGAFRTVVGDLGSLAPAERRRVLWEQQDVLAELLARERQVSRWAMALALGLAMALGAVLARRAGQRGAVAGVVVPVVVLLALGPAYPVLYYGATTNVDALALAFSLATLVALLSERVLLAAVLAALATAVKDPAFVLGPVVLAGAWLTGRPRGGRLVLRAAGAGLLAYALAAGALTSPGTWWDHVRYLVGAGVEGVARIDPGDPSQWPGLLAYAGRLGLGVLGGAVTGLGLLGLLVLLRRDRAGAGLLLGAGAATLLLFVIPAGFVYVRFLLVPLALLAVGAGCLAGSVLEALMRLGGRDDPGRRLVAGLAAVALLFGGDEVYRWLAHGRPWARAPLAPAESLVHDLRQATDPRAAAADAVAARLPAGRRVVVFADAREHGPPLDPLRWQVDVRGLGEADALLSRWLAGPPGDAPELLLLMNFPTELPDGSGVLPDPPPAPGTPVAGRWIVRDVFGGPTRDVVERTLAVRPTLTLLERTGP